MNRLRPAILVAGLWLAGCSTVPDPPTVMRDNVAGHRVLVQLEKVDAGRAVAYAHPVSVEAEKLAEGIEGFLAELAYGRPKGGRLVRMLEVGDRQRLAAGLAAGLRSASPDQRVAFLLAIDEGGEVPWFTPDERMTRGIAFVDRQGRFHLAFDLVDDRVDPHDLDPYDPTERAQTRARIVSESGQDIGATAGGKRRLWVAWDLLPASSANEAMTADDDPRISDADAARFELLDELLRDGILDREEYERRRARLQPAD